MHKIKGIGGYDSLVVENVDYLQELKSIALLKNLKTCIVWDQDSFSSIEKSESQVIFVPSFTQQQRSWLFLHSECLVDTPSFEHFGIVPIEAMASGLPVIAVNNGGPTESIINGETGFLCESKPQEFALAIQKILGDSLSMELGMKGRQRVQNHFSFESFTNSLEQHCHDLLVSRNKEAIRMWKIWNMCWLSCIWFSLNGFFTQFTSWMFGSLILCLMIWSLLE